ncbi:Uu.00g105580.m01.CDS01 [Anthostomella pinea]|uniref:Uu.00g105580.m01.CDS01 n=1 Tax=Anthostomella pinea TaxID=933095 RepID=A0AAI8YFT9_9PEZI|nr:Uu.00g105580.m01.CDS01 [Anthostomella pinea]
MEEMEAPSTPDTFSICRKLNSGAKQALQLPTQDDDTDLAMTLVVGNDHAYSRMTPRNALEGYHAWAMSIGVPPTADLVSKGFDRLEQSPGGRLGLGPKTVEASDLVVVPWGCHLPVILRPLSRKGEYSVVGVSNVHGIMDGEAVEQHEAAGKSEEVFYLR